MDAFMTARAERGHDCVETIFRADFFFSCVYLTWWMMEEMCVESPTKCTRVFSWMIWVLQGETPVDIVGIGSCPSENTRSSSAQSTAQ